MNQMTDRPFEVGRVQRASFLERLNRFVVRCRMPKVGLIDAYLPNPGRLCELLLPGATLYLTDRVGPASRSSATRKARYRYTVLAVDHDGTPILLHTQLSNQVARLLIDEKRIPGLADAEVVAAEVPVGGSRFDFLLRRGGRKSYLEVKSCTLFGNRVAMFPDAVSQRARRHLVELAGLSRRNARSCVLFLIHTPHVDWFMPDFHTDFAFSQTMLDVRRKLQFLPVAIEWTDGLRLAPQVKSIEIPWRSLCREIVDRGSYLLIMELSRDQTITVGRQGPLHFRGGHYIYVGSAMANLSQRIARHLRRRKKLHWHIDYLRQCANNVTALPIRSSQRQECEVAQAMSAIFPYGPQGFGSSDCKCRAHLFWHQENPLHCTSFHTMLHHFRMQSP